MMASMSHSKSSDKASGVDMFLWWAPKMKICLGPPKKAWASPGADIQIYKSNPCVLGCCILCLRCLFYSFLEDAYVDAL